MSYQIEIRQTREVVKKEHTEWAKVGSVEEKRQYGEGTYIGDKMGWTPPIDKVTTEERVVLRQEVDELDLSAVIRAINGL